MKAASDSNQKWEWSKPKFLIWITLNSLLSRTHHQFVSFLLLSFVSSLSRFILDTKEMSQANSFIASCSVLRLSTGSTVCGCGNVASMSERQGGIDDKRKEGQCLQCFFCRPAENHKEDGARELTRGCQKKPSIKPNPAGEQHKELWKCSYYTANYYYDMKIVEPFFFPPNFLSV